MEPGNLENNRQKHLEKKREYQKKFREEYLRLKNNPDATPSLPYHGKKYSSVIEAYEARLEKMRHYNSRISELRKQLKLNRAK